MADPRILYMEDELSLGGITYDMLVKNGFSVRWMQDGKKALALFRSEPFDICVVDIMMPGLDGYSFVKEIRKINDSVPIIFLSARVLTDDVVKGFELGGNDYLKKPFSIEELIVRIQALLGRKKIVASEPEIIPIGKYEFNYAQMELRLGDQRTVLSDRTNKLIYLLIKNKNDVLDRKKTLIDLWGDDSFFNARSMDVFITRIRKYLADDPSISIVNVRGVGYRMLVNE